jgi:tetratricopeptide (TPR) repeat protein
MFLRLASREAEPLSGVGEICRLAGYLPLAISLLARVYAGHPSWTLTDLKREAEAGMLEMSAEEESVAMAFALSYLHLPAALQRFLRRLGMHPGVTITAAAAAELAKVSAEEAARHLGVLRRDGLLIEVSHRRYVMHDLIRLYASGLSKYLQGERRDALLRLAHSSYGWVNYAFAVQNQGNPMVDTEFLVSWIATGPPGINAVDKPWVPTAWFAAEEANLIAVTKVARDAELSIVDEGWSPTAWFAAEEANLIAVTKAARDAELPITARLACSMFYFLEISSQFDEWRLVEQIGADAAVTHADKAKSLRNRGRIAFVQSLEQQERLYLNPDERPLAAGALGEATSFLKESLALYRSESNRNGEATVLRELADAYRLEIEPNRPDTVQKTIDAYLAARTAYTALGNENALASLRLALGITYACSGQYPEAEYCYRKSLIFAGTTDANGRAQHGRLKAYSLRRLADLYRDQDDLYRAIEHYQRSVTAFTVDVDDPIGKARALSYCALVHSELKDLAAARECLLQAHKIFAGRPLGNQDLEAKVVEAWLEQLDNDETRSPSRRMNRLIPDKPADHLMKGSSWPIRRH